MQAPELRTIEDDSQKQLQPLWQLVGMAILRAPNHRLSIEQMVEWIEGTFSFYKADRKCREQSVNAVQNAMQRKKAIIRPSGDFAVSSVTQRKMQLYEIVPGQEEAFSML